MKHLWDKRYASEEYIYGTDANDFFAEELKKIKPGYLLEAGAGEGRNAVYAASLGWDVTAVDQSEKAMEKTMSLAKKQDIEIQYHLVDINDLDLQENCFDAISVIYLHLEPENRKVFHKKVYDMLKPGGVLIMESFSKEQLKFNTGGPKNPDMLYSEEILKNDFKDFTDLKIKTVERELKEGAHHNGTASCIQVLGVKYI